MTGQLKPSQALHLNLQNGHSQWDPITGLESKTHFGRPDFKIIFEDLKRRLPAHFRLGVFYCGPVVLGAQLKKLCVRSSTSQQIFEFYRETF